MTSGRVMDGDLIAEREGRVGIIRLNRPKAINAMTLEMLRDIDRAITKFEHEDSVSVILLEGEGERGLCAGGDIRALWEASHAKGGLGEVLWREEYILNARIAHLQKPYIALMDGIVMGGGVGISAHARHRVVTDETKLAMPEVGLGFFPDVGATWLLPHAPGETGTYFGLTGAPMNGPDAVHAKFADHVVPQAKLFELRHALTNIHPGAADADVWDLLRSFATGAKAGPVAALQPEIDKLFGYDSVAEIFAALEDDGNEFAKATLKTLREKSPRGLSVALRLMRLGRQSMTLEECLIREYRAALAVFASDDFREGVRAAVIDKDRKPRWSPPSIEGITQEMIAPYFTSLGDKELVFDKGVVEKHDTSLREA